MPRGGAWGKAAVGGVAAAPPMG